jgi:hypothetical protein
MTPAPRLRLRLRPTALARVVADGAWLAAGERREARLVRFPASPAARRRDEAGGRS